MRFTRLDDWLKWQESCHPQAIDLGLDRVRQVAGHLGLLAPAAKIVTIAGTNGKGSCATALAALLRCAGLACGVYTSPHILHYRERIKLDGEFATDADLCRAFAAIDAARGSISLTYFEFGTLAALYLFAERRLPYWVLEVGLGGRLDATNLLDPTVAVITSIALDHVEWLGPDRESIGREKAGICRPHTPLVCADPAPPQTVLQAAERLACPLYQIDRDFGYSETEQGTAFWLGNRRFDAMAVQLPKPSLAAALQVGYLLGLDAHSLAPSAYAGLELPGRLQRVMAGHRPVYLDVAHNPAAMAHLAQQLRERLPNAPVDLVVAMMGDKNLPDSLAPLAPLVNHWYLASVPDLPRAAATAQLRAALPTGSSSESFATVAEALDAALSSTSQGAIVVTGSFYTVAEATRYLKTGEPA